MGRRISQYMSPVMLKRVPQLYRRMMTLPVFAYTQYMYAGIPVQAYHDRAWAAALILIVIVMVLNLIARLVAKIFSPKLGR